MLYLTIHHFSVWIDKVTKIVGLTDDVLWGEIHPNYFFIDRFTDPLKFNSKQSTGFT